VVERRDRAALVNTSPFNFATLEFQEISMFTCKKVVAFLGFDPDIRLQN